MIVVDTSALIEYYRPAGNATVAATVTKAIEADEVAVNGIIQTEIMGFVASKKEFHQLSLDFQAFHWLSLDRAVFESAAQLGFDLRRTGITVPATDLLIAASAIKAQATLYHLDSHFTQISNQSKLAERNLKV